MMDFFFSQTYQDIRTHVTTSPEKKTHFKLYKNSKMRKMLKNLIFFLYHSPEWKYRRITGPCLAPELQNLFAVMLRLKLGMC